MLVARILEVLGSNLGGDTRVLGEVYRSLSQL
jgi:hypothetical protein